MNLGGVDGADGSFGVGVGGEEDALGVGIDRQGLLEEVDSGHSGHALVGEEEGDRVLALLKLAADVERGSAGGGADDAVVLAVVAAQVLDHSFQYAGVVVDGEQDRLRHIPLYLVTTFRYSPRMIRLWATPPGFRKISFSEQLRRMRQLTGLNCPNCRHCRFSAAIDR